MVEPDKGDREPGAENVRLRSVLVRLSARTTSEVALEAALRVARAFRSPIVGLMVEDSDLRALAALPFAREVSILGTQNRRLSLSDLEHDLGMMAVSMRRRLEDMGRQASVPVQFRVVCEESDRMVEALCAACAADTVVAFADPFVPTEAAVLHRLMKESQALEGIMLVGPVARRIEGPVIVCVEAGNNVERLLSFARSIVGASTDALIILAVDDPRAGSEARQDELRAMLPPELLSRIVWADATRGEPAVIVETVRRLGAGFVIAEYGSTLAPSEGSLSHLVQALECPLLLVR